MVFKAKMELTKKFRYYFDFKSWGSTKFSGRHLGFRKFFEGVLGSASTKRLKNTGLIK
jgi:hypothetical protein